MWESTLRGFENDWLFLPFVFVNWQSEGKPEERKGSIFLFVYLQTRSFNTVNSPSWSTMFLSGVLTFFAFTKTTTHRATNNWLGVPRLPPLLSKNKPYGGPPPATLRRKYIHIPLKLAARSSVCHGRLSHSAQPQTEDVELNFAEDKLSKIGSPHRWSSMRAMANDHEPFKEFLSTTSVHPYLTPL